jgi:hypothetical protein
MVIVDVISRFQSITTESNPLTRVLVHDFYPAILNLIKKGSGSPCIFIQILYVFDSAAFSAPAVPFVIPLRLALSAASSGFVPT